MASKVKAATKRRPRTARAAKKPLPLSGPPNQLQLSDLTYFIWPAGQALHRIHLACYKPTVFNPLKTGNARFSPIYDSKKKVIPTIYAGTNFDCAAMETVFHNVPYRQGAKTLFADALEGRCYSVISATKDIKLIDLSTIALHKLGIERSALIDTTAVRYASTRKWAEALHALDKTVQGLRWVSRQNDLEQAVVLFGDRILAKELTLTTAPRDLMKDAGVYSQVQTLARQIGVWILSGKP